MAAEPPPSEPPGAEPRGIVRRRTGPRALRWVGMGLGAVVLAAVVIAVGLVATTPSPQPRPGWAALPDLPNPRGEVASTVADQDGQEVLVVAGGLEGLMASTSTAVHRFAPTSGAWERLPDLPGPRHHAAAAAVGGDVYVSGGAPSVTDWNPQDSLWVLPEGAEGWGERAPMPEGRDSHRMRALGGRLHVVGGRGDTADTLVYHPASDRWTRAAPLPEPRHHLGVVVHAEEMWAIGGRDHDERVLDSVHIWNPGEGTWREGPRLPRPVSAGVEAVVDGNVHLVGGEDPAVVGGGVIDDHLVLDPETGDWRTGDAAPVSVHGAGGGVLAGRLVVAGGASRQGALSVTAWTGHAAVHD